jgi:hypothetical protein
MNIQDIADFIDLVKNPAKYEAAITRIQEQTNSMLAAVELVGKANDLDALRKKVEKQAAKLEADFSQRVVDLEASYKTRAALIQEQQVRAEAVAVDASKSLQAATEKEQQTIALQNSFAGRENALKKKELDIAAESDRLSALMTEYEEKVAKLRSVMA